MGGAAPYKLCPLYSVSRQALMGRALFGTFSESAKATGYPSAHIVKMLAFVSRRFVRSQVIFANTMFRAVCYRFDECQVITGGTDRKVSW